MTTNDTATTFDHAPCCTAHGVPMDCERYRRTHFVEVRPCCSKDAARLVAEIDAMPCEMYHEQPFDFAYCERHDTTFALGDVCKFQKINAAGGAA